MTMTRRCIGKRSFTLVELLVVIAIIALLAGILIPNLGRIRERALRVRCSTNLKGLFTAANVWLLDPDDPFRSRFPAGRLFGEAGALIHEEGITPDILICPTAAGGQFRGTFRPAYSLEAVTDTNSTYNYFPNRAPEEGNAVLFSDAHGHDGTAPRNVQLGDVEATWGGNHDGRGGNVVLVSGAVFWFAATGIVDAAEIISDRLDAFTYRPGRAPDDPSLPRY